MTRVCANCGTEVDDEALFCPTCGQPIESGAQPDLPPAPEWPESVDRQLESAPDARHVHTAAEPPPAPLAPDVAATAAPATAGMAGPSDDSAGEDSYVPPWRRERPSEPPADVSVEPAREEQTGSMAAASRPDVARDTPAPAPPMAAPISPAPPRPGAARSAIAPAGFIVRPTTLSGWLVGLGALVAVVALFLPWYSYGNYTAVWGFASGVNILVAVVLLAVLAAIFLAHLLPDIPRRDLAMAGIGTLGLGIAIDRVGLGGTGIGVLLFLVGTLAIAAGGLVILLGVDRPLGETTP
jgi:zinc-ribbon domain